MNQSTQILFVHDPKNLSGRAFVQALQNSIQGPTITVKDTGMSTLFLDLSKFDLAHFFMSGSAKFASFSKKAKGKKTIQTVMSPPKKPEDYASLIFADHVIVFSNQEKAQVEKYKPGASVDCILPCVELRSVSERKPSGLIRAEYTTGEQLLTVAFGELTNQKDFGSLLYIIREYQRRGGFRLLLFLIHPVGATKTWKERLQYSIDKENLRATTILNDSSDVFSLIDSSDLVLYLARREEPNFSFPLRPLQALSLGKPMLCYNVPPVNEAVSGFQPSWLCQNTEDVVRASVDINKEAIHLEQISTEVARYTQSRISPGSVSSRYLEVYEKLLKT